MSDYYPTLADLREFRLKANISDIAISTPQFKSGYIKRTDGFDVDESIRLLEDKNETGESSELIFRIKSVSDLTWNLYQEFNQNPNSIGNWFYEIEKANKKSELAFKLPKTKIWKLPVELSQFIRIEYPDTNQISKELFNKMVFDVFDLDNEKEYFIKTGTFSSKFEFRNAHITKGEASEMGEYFQVINNFAMFVGAAHSNEICVREYIQDTEGNPTIYSGMPLRTEFRAFVDFDLDHIIGVVPYWHPIVMKRALGNSLASKTIQQDFETYKNHEDKLNREYNEFLPLVRKTLESLIPNVSLKGKYSVDIMKNGQDLYLIDMATMETSALTELLE